MAQSALTVTPTSPTPPTNFTTTFLGTTPPTSPSQTVIDDGAAGTLTVFGTNRASVDNANFPSVPHEGAGTEVTVVAPGSRTEAPTVSFSDLGNYTTTPNQQHASSMSPAYGSNPTLASLTPATAASGTGTQGLTVTGTNFTPGCRIWVNNQERPTTFISATSMSTTFAKSGSAGVWPVDVKLGGVPVATTRNFTWT